jgi:16S rRNA (guanine966-N2)-methyltransferase
MTTLRVIAGEKGGRRIVAPEGWRTRPTSERVREAAFSMLESALGERRGGLSGAVVWDLFAGSGALGIEALSRGAGEATFVDQSRSAVSAVQENLAKLGYPPERGHVYCAEVLRWVHGLDDEPGGEGRSRRGPEARTPPDLVLADPPYSWHSWPVLLRALSALGPLVLMETSDEPTLPEGWRVQRARRYGGTLVTLTVPGASPAQAGGL